MDEKTYEATVTEIIETDMYSYAHTLIRIKGIKYSGLEFPRKLADQLGLKENDKLLITIKKQEVKHESI